MPNKKGDVGVAQVLHKTSLHLPNYDQQEELQRFKEKKQGSSSTMSTPWVSLLIHSV